MKGSIATLLALGTLAMAGCVNTAFMPFHAGHADSSSSLVDFLYPDGRVPAPAAELNKFEADVRSGTAPIRVVSKNAPGTAGAGGGGALGAGFIGLLLLTVARRVASQH
jgi:hypothetical protein